VIVEKAVVDCLEINVSVVGYDMDLQASVAEQPINHDEFLSFADKYERGGKKSGMASASRRIPAPISQAVTAKVQDLAKRLFHLFDCSGVVRIDFFVNPTTEDIFVTELNTIPGSMSYYLWEASGVPYPALVDKLVEIARTKHDRRSAYTTTFSSSILASANA
jgi:D-alanine-D-alanine ligase